MQSQAMTIRHEHVMQRMWLKRFLSWLTPLIFGFGTLEIIAFAVWRERSSGMTGISILIYGCGLLAAWKLVNNAQLRQGLVLICGGLLLATLGIAIVQPGITATLAMMPLLVVAVALPYISGTSLRFVIIVGWISTVLIAIAGEAPPPQDNHPFWFAIIFRVGSLIAAATMVLLLLWQFSSRLREALAHAHSVNDQLQATLDEVETRAAAQARLLAENQQQRDTIRELSAPILPISQQTLLIPLIGSLDRDRLIFIREQALHALHRSRARRLVLDITGIIDIDTGLAQELIGFGQAARLLGAEVMLVGIRGSVARQLVQLGVDLEGMQSYRDLEMALTTITR